MSVLLVAPERLAEPVFAVEVAARQLTGAAQALRRHAVDTGRADSTDAVSMLVRALAAEADVLAHDADDDARALRAGVGLYLSTEQRLMVT